MAGKFIEVVNTDAEGRLTLADAVTFARENEKATKIIDIATLTGAVLSALGLDYAGIRSLTARNFIRLFESIKDVQRENLEASLMRA